MKTWVRFQQGDAVKFGTLEGDTISVYSGNMFDNPKATGETVKRADVKLMTPCSPSKMILLWNNFYALSSKLGVAIPEEPLYLLKPSTSYIADGEIVNRIPTTAKSFTKANLASLSANAARKFPKNKPKTISSAIPVPMTLLPAS